MSKPIAALSPVRETHCAKNPLKVRLPISNMLRNKQKINALQSREKTSQISRKCVSRCLYLLSRNPAIV